MADQELRKLLDHIHGEIEQIDNVDEKGQELLRHLGKDINDLLARSEEKSTAAPQRTVERLEETIDYFEVTHPNLTLMISKLLDTLSSSGI